MPLFAEQAKTEKSKPLMRILPGNTVSACLARWREKLRTNMNFGRQENESRLQSIVQQNAVFPSKNGGSELESAKANLIGSVAQLVEQRPFKP